MSDPASDTAQGRAGARAAAAGRVSARAGGGSATPREREPWLATVIRALVHAVAAAVFAYPLSVSLAVGAAALGAATGSVAGRLLGQTRARPVPVVAAAVAAVLLVGLVSGLAVGEASFAAAVGPATALRVGHALELGLGALVVSTFLRFLSSRRRFFAILEVGFVTAAFAQLVVAHRHGAINRPFEIADPILAQGGDPTVVVIGVGAVAASVVVLFLLTERSLLRSVLHVGLLALLLFGVVAGTAVVGLPAPPQTGAGLGLRGDEDEGDDAQGGGGASGRRDNEELEFRDNYDSDANNVPVGIVLLHDDYAPPSGIYYLRQGAFSQYNGRRLVAATRADVDRDLAPYFPTSPLEIPGAPLAGAARATVETTVALLADHNRPFALEAPLALEPAPNPDPRRFRRVYRATSAALTADLASMLGARSGDGAWSSEQRAHYLEAPEDPRYAQLAEEILAALPEELRDEPVVRALAITDFLGREGTYSLRTRHADAGDPTASFLFGDKTGYCVHFAHAGAYLMRAAGLPSRVATGYAVDEASRAGGSALLLSGNASHAWPEAYIDGVGWVVFDVSPERVLSPPPSAPDPDLQRLLGELLRGQRPLPVDARPVPPVGDLAAAALSTAAQGLGLLVAGLLLLSFLIKAWRRLVPALSSYPSLPRVVYRAELDRLAEVELVRRFGESREAFAARIEETLPSFRALTRAHVGAAFGSRRPATDARAFSRALRAERRRAFPWWRRLAGALVPWSWIRSR